MFEMVFIIVSRVLMVLLGFWVYRKLSAWGGFRETLFGRRGSLMQMTRTGQKGFVGVNSKDGKRKSLIKRNRNKEVKAPWGW